MKVACFLSVDEKMRSGYQDRSWTDALAEFAIFVEHLLFIFEVES